MCAATHRSLEVHVADTHDRIGHAGGCIRQALRYIWSLGRNRTGAYNDCTLIAWTKIQSNAKVPAMALDTLIVMTKSCLVHTP